MVCDMCLSVCRIMMTGFKNFVNPKWNDNIEIANEVWIVVDKVCGALFHIYTHIYELVLKLGGFA